MNETHDSDRQDGEYGSRELPIRHLPCHDSLWPRDRTTGQPLTNAKAREAGPFELKLLALPDLAHPGFSVESDRRMTVEGSAADYKRAYVKGASSGQRDPDRWRSGISPIPRR